MTGRVSLHLCSLYEQDWRTPLHSFMTVKRCTAALGEEGGQRSGGEEEKKQRHGFLHQAFHLSPAIGHQKWKNTNSKTLHSIPISFSSGPVETRKNEKIKKALLQCPKRAETITHAQRNLTALSQRQYQQKNSLGFHIKMAFHRAKAISNLHLARPLIIIKYFLCAPKKEANNLGKRSSITKHQENKLIMKSRSLWFLKSEHTVCLTQTNTQMKTKLFLTDQ